MSLEIQEQLLKKQWIQMPNNDRGDDVISITAIKTMPFKSSKCQVISRLNEITLVHTVEKLFSEPVNAF